MWSSPSRSDGGRDAGTWRTMGFSDNNWLSDNKEKTPNLNYLNDYFYSYTFQT